MTPARRNPLLSRPPGHHHRLRNEQRLVSKGWAEPWVGVHVADSKLIAAGYAFSAWNKMTFTKNDPIIIRLNVTGLHKKAEPDVDALLWWYDHGGDYQTREVLEHGDMSDHDVEAWDGHYVSDYLIGYLPNQMDWERISDDPDLMENALAGEHTAIKELLLRGFPQRRYLHDFDLDRVLEIETFEIWNDEVLRESEYDLTDDDLKTGILIDEIDSFEPVWKQIYQKPGYQARMTQYFHGTTSDALYKAFPELEKKRAKANPRKTLKTYVPCPAGVHDEALEDDAIWETWPLLIRDTSMGIETRRCPACSSTQSRVLPGFEENPWRRHVYEVVGQRDDTEPGERSTMILCEVCLPTVDDFFTIKKKRLSSGPCDRCGLDESD